MKVILLGPPGSGKGTQAAKIKEYLSVPHISTGDIFRANISNGTELGILAKSFMDKGVLVPDEVTVGMVKDRINQDDCKNGFIFDGFPRTIPQAEKTSEMVDIDVIINIEVPDSELIDRMTGRRSCSNKDCQAIFHIKYNPPKVEGVCDICGSELIQRKDQELDAVKERLEVYHSQTKPLIDYYSGTIKIINIDGTKSIDEVFENIKSELSKL
jgi:adenylate kinase